MLNHELFMQYFTGLCERYDKQATVALCDIYYMALEDLNDEQLKKSVSNVLRSREYSSMPSPAELRGEDIENDALLALDKMEKAIERYGLYRSVRFDDPVIHMVVRSMGGWPAICRKEGEEGEDWTWRRKEFVKLYRAFAMSPRAECPVTLIGLAESENNGLPMVHIVGDGKKALAWTEGRKELESPKSDTLNLMKQLVAVTVGK